MTLEHFKIVKRNTEQYMTYMLGLSRQLGYPLKDFCGEQVITTVTIEDKEEGVELQDKLKQIMAMKDPKVSGSTRASGRYDYFKSVTFTNIDHKVREAIHPDLVQAEMKKFVRRQLGIALWGTIHCEIMDLFKKGRIEWDEVVQAHKGECSL